MTIAGQGAATRMDAKLMFTRRGLCDTPSCFRKAGSPARVRNCYKVHIWKTHAEMSAHLLPRLEPPRLDSVERLAPEKSLRATPLFTEDTLRCDPETARFDPSRHRFRTV